jgi:hypothetical protein
MLPPEDSASTNFATRAIISRVANIGKLFTAFVLTANGYFSLIKTASTGSGSFLIS